MSGPAAITAGMALATSGSPAGGWCRPVAAAYGWQATGSTAGEGMRGCPGTGAIAEDSGDKVAALRFVARASGWGIRPPLPEKFAQHRGGFLGQNSGSDGHLMIQARMIQHLQD